MKKKNIFYKWWFQLIAMAAILGIFLIAFYLASPVKKINKSAGSYKISNVNSSPQKVLSVFLRSVYKEDVNLFKKTITKREYYEYEDDYYNRHMTDENIMDDLKSANEMMKNKFGSEWFNKVIFVDYGTMTYTDEKVYVIRVKWNNTEQNVITTAKLGLGFQYYITSDTMREFLHDKEIQ